MINIYEVNETNKMIEKENLDVRTITMGISLLDCADSDLEKVKNNIYNKITTVAKDLVKTGQDIEKEFGIPIVNKRISITPIAMVGNAATILSTKGIGIDITPPTVCRGAMKISQSYAKNICIPMSCNDDLILELDIAVKGD